MNALYKIMIYYIIIAFWISSFIYDSIKLFLILYLLWLYSMRWWHLFIAHWPIPNIELVGIYGQNVNRFTDRFRGLSIIFMHFHSFRIKWTFSGKFELFVVASWVEKRKIIMWTVRWFNHYYYFYWHGIF